MNKKILLVLTVAVAASIAGCSSSAHSKHATDSPSASGSMLAGTGSASVGSLTIDDAYIPQPASPDVAAAYFVVKNSGSTPDKLVSIRTDAAKMAMAMTESDSGSTGTMTDLTDVTVPAHGQFAFSAGHAHVMLENPTSVLKMGQKVVLTITFAKNGTVSLQVPVVSVMGPDSSMTMSGGSMSSMNMPGMHG